MKKTTPITIISVLLLLIANVSYWLSTTIYNPQNFSNLIVQTYQENDVRNAIAGEIVDNSLQTKPMVRQVIGEPIQAAISGILGSQISQNLLNKAAVRFQNYLTTDNRQDVTIETGQVATFIKSAATSVSPELGSQVPDVPVQTVTLVKANSLPDINKWTKPIMNLGPIAGFIGLALLVYLFYKSEDKGMILRKIGIYLLIGTVLLAFLVPYFRTVLQSNISDQNAEIVATATYNNFASILTTQLSYFAIIAIGLYIIGFYLNKRETLETKAND